MDVRLEPLARQLDGHTAYTCQGPDGCGALVLAEQAPEHAEWHLRQPSGQAGAVKYWIRKRGKWEPFPNLGGLSPEVVLEGERPGVGSPDEDVHQVGP